MKVATIVAPASPAPIEQKKAIESFFNKEGFQVHFAPHVFAAERYLAGADNARADDLNHALTDKETDIVVALRGGYGSPRLLDKLDYKAIKKPINHFLVLVIIQLFSWRFIKSVRW